MKMIVEEDGFDVLLPRQAKDGSLCFIRRPYQPLGQVSIWRMIQDALLFPFRLVRAIVHFLNFFSLMFTKRPLMTANGPDREGPDQRFLMLFGRVIDAQKLARASKDGQPVALVPASWVLVRKTTDGAESILAKHVLSYDLCPDGSFVYSNGSRIFHVTPTGDPSEIARGKLIERVAVLGA